VVQHEGDEDIENIFTLPVHNEQSLNIFNTMEQLEMPMNDINTDLTFSPSSFLKHYNIYSPSTTNTLDNMVTHHETVEYTQEHNDQEQPKEPAATTLVDEVNPLEAVVEETVQALDFNWDQSPGHHPVMLPINTILRTNSWYYINDQGVLSSTLDYSNKIDVQGDIIGNKKPTATTQTDNVGKEKGCQATVNLEHMDTQTCNTLQTQFTQTETKMDNKTTQHTPDTQDKGIQCTDLQPSTTSTTESNTNTDNNIIIPMAVTLNMGNAHQAPKWEWP
jgi:hypothetical protein